MVRIAKSFIAKLINDAQKKKSHVCVGIDPDIKRIPSFIKEKAQKEFGDSKEAIGRSLSVFSKDIIDAVKDYALAIKLQIAWFEEYGAFGWQAIEEIVDHAHEQELLVIIDVKRGDIGVTANAYARTYLGNISFWPGLKKEGFGADAITLNPYLGKDSLDPFLKEMIENHRGAFVLVKTTNPSSKDIQDLPLASGELVYEKVASLVSQWGQEVLCPEKNYSNLGAVVGATFPEAATKIRSLMPNSYFLVPGYGAQGGRSEDLLSFFNEDGLGALITASRSIMYAYEGKEETAYKEHISKACQDMRDSINEALAKANKLNWR